ncbi:hypothetical protein O7600_16545 [Micromonospora sp. WMMA1998]|uniref:hypothetical protein n=1 Tax=Micromonospora sp. WMMA1998 TaxID=3015167 RepID=UPI00248C0F1B|nr:hypothetical protein [Micromonospora sp. WMMA1998]WBC12793.1 hypothetical protein O7600_16545 [Micromonospora sp. WMMA1998]
MEQQSRLTNRRRLDGQCRPDHGAGTIAGMRDADTPPQEPADRRYADTAPTPQEHAARIRAAAAEVRERVQDWRHAPGWQETPTNALRYAVTADAVAALSALPKPETLEDLAATVDAVRPVLAEWRPSRPGPEQQIFAAVERLRQACG